MTRPQDAVHAEIICWGRRGLGVRYTLPDGAQEAHQMGTDDGAILAQLDRAGKLAYLDDDVRKRYETMKQVGVFRMAVPDDPS
jgi:hypothetical protein